MTMQRLWPRSSLNVTRCPTITPLLHRLQNKTLQFGPFLLVVSGGFLVLAPQPVEGSPQFFLRGGLVGFHRPDPDLGHPATLAQVKTGQAILVLLGLQEPQGALADRTLAALALDDDIFRL